MIDEELYRRHVVRFGHTLTVSRWDMGSGERVNEMMRAALEQRGPPMTDALVAADLTTGGSSWEG